MHKDMFVDKSKIHLTKDNFDVGINISFLEDVYDAKDNIMRYFRM